METTWELFIHKSKKIEKQLRCFATNGSTALFFFNNYDRTLGDLNKVNSYKAFGHIELYACHRLIFIGFL